MKSQAGKAVSLVMMSSRILGAGDLDSCSIARTATVHPDSAGIREENNLLVNPGAAQLMLAERDAIYILMQSAANQALGMAPCSCSPLAPSMPTMTCFSCLICPVPNTVNPNNDPCPSHSSL